MHQSPVSPRFELCDVQDAWLAPFDQDAEERQQRAEALEGTDEITYDPQVELEGESGEARRAKVVTDPGKPTAQEVAEHEITHLPHRSWCPSCVAGRARDRPHVRSRGRDEHSIPTIVFD